VSFLDASEKTKLLARLGAYVVEACADAGSGASPDLDHLREASTIRI
jgi:hypothetical protein